MCLELSLHIVMCVTIDRHTIQRKGLGQPKSPSETIDAICQRYTAMTTQQTPVSRSGKRFIREFRSKDSQKLDQTNIPKNVNHRHRSHG